MDTRLIVIGTDMLTSDRIIVLDPIGLNDMVRLRNVAARLLCAGGLPAGAVIGVSVKASEIRSKAFLNSFPAYLRTVRFRPIPEKVGAMTFDFSFEFNPEM